MLLQFRWWWCVDSEHLFALWRRTRTSGRELVVQKQWWVAKRLANNWHHGWCTDDVIDVIRMTSLLVFNQTFGYPSLPKNIWWIMLGVLLRKNIVNINYFSIINIGTQYRIIRKPSYQFQYQYCHFCLTIFPYQCIEQADVVSLETLGKHNFSFGLLLSCTALN